MSNTLPMIGYPLGPGGKGTLFREVNRFKMKVKRRRTIDTVLGYCKRSIIVVKQRGKNRDVLEFWAHMNVMSSVTHYPSQEQQMMRGSLAGILFLSEDSIRRGYPQCL